MSVIFTFHLSTQIFNATDELEASAGYNDIRFTVLKRVTSDVEEQDIEPQVKPPSPWLCLTLTSNCDCLNVSRKWALISSNISSLLRIPEPPLPYFCLTPILWHPSLSAMYDPSSHIDSIKINYPSRFVSICWAPLPHSAAGVYEQPLSIRLLGLTPLILPPFAPCLLSAFSLPGISTITCLKGLHNTILSHLDQIDNSAFYWHIYLGKPQWKKRALYLGFAQIAIIPTPSPLHSNGLLFFVGASFTYEDKKGNYLQWRTPSVGSYSLSLGWNQVGRDEKNWIFFWEAWQYLDTF